MTENAISFIIPVYNRPQEIKELLESFTKLSSKKDFENEKFQDVSTDDSHAFINE